MITDSSRDAVAFHTMPLSEEAREALADALVTAFPEVAQVSLKMYDGSGWVGAVELEPGAAPGKPAKAGGLAACRPARRHRHGRPVPI